MRIYVFALLLNFTLPWLIAKLIAIVIKLPYKCATVLLDSSLSFVLLSTSLARLRPATIGVNSGWPSLVVIYPLLINSFRVLQGASYFEKRDRRADNFLSLIDCCISVAESLWQWQKERKKSTKASKLTLIRRLSSAFQHSSQFSVLSFEYSAEFWVLSSEFWVLNLKSKYWEII